jgi:D-alanine-D-alanine ligase
MRIGIAFDVKPQTPIPAGAPDDLHEEFDSPATVQSIAVALRELGHEPIELGNGKPMLERLLRDPPELVFNFAEGHGTSRNREARVPAVCEMLDIPCTGSDPLTLALALDKDMCRRVVADGGVGVPKGILLSPPPGDYDGDCAEFPGMIVQSALQLPLIAKPNLEGSSKGIRSKCLIETLEDAGPVIVSLWRDYRQAVLLEEFIAGDEVTVGIVGNDMPRILGMMRVLPKQPTDRFVYSLEVKRDWANRVKYECPPQLPEEALRELEMAALNAYGTLGCRDVARLDFRVRDGRPFFLEANPLPGLNPETGDIVSIARFMGLTHTQLIGAIVEAALARTARGLDG